MRLFITICLALPFCLAAQDGSYPLGARGAALSNTSVTIADHWSLFNNPGAMGALEATAMMVSYQNRYNLKGFHVTGGGAIVHHRFFNIGAKYFKFGDRWFNQQLLGVVIANKFQMVSLGGGASIIQTHTKSVNTRRVWVGEFGGLANITDFIVFGAHIFNFKHGSLHPTTMRAGLSLKPKDYLQINIEIEKQIDSKEKFKSGIEYAVIPLVHIRTGIKVQGSPFGDTDVAATFGFGFRPTHLLFDYAFASGNLGAIHEVSLSYAFTAP